jgi:hypothetical protein
MKLIEDDLKRGVSMKYNIQYNIGKVKYLVSWYEGVKKHKDGSEAWDVACFKSKVKMNQFISKFRKDQYGNITINS